MLQPNTLKYFLWDLRQPEVAEVEERRVGSLVFGDEFEGFFVTVSHRDEE